MGFGVAGGGGETVPRKEKTVVCAVESRLFLSCYEGVDLSPLKCFANKEITFVGECPVLLVFPYFCCYSLLNINIVII